jgi:hypothetical protein
MKINDYIIRGGENLNSSPLKTPSFPDVAERIFNEWHTKLGKDDKEKENYFELPVNPSFRLFIRAFNIEKPGNRPICFYVGILIPKDAYIEAKDYYCIHKGLCSVSYAQVKEAANSSFQSLEIAIDWPIPRTSIGLDFNQLSKVRLYGEKDFSSNINQMCFSISINNIDDWFSRLFIAVNPYRMSRSFHIVISREQPRPAMPDDKHINSQYAIETPKVVPTPKPIAVQNDLPAPQKRPPKNPNRLRWVIFPVLLLSICTSIYHLCNCRDKIPLADYYSLKDERDSFEKTNQELSDKCSGFERDNKLLENDKKRLEEELEKKRLELSQINEELERIKKEYEELKRKQNTSFPIMLR